MWHKLSRTVFGEPAGVTMPVRVRQSIAAQQQQAEILTGWAQLALVVFFIVLYAVTPKTSDGTPFRPVPYVLGLYLSFTLLRLVLATRWRLPRWFVLGSVIGDIGLLMVLIWSFHMQYQQPAPFYLKAPTLLYVFIFIALRTLRFEPVYVITAGLAAAAGWLVLAAYAVGTHSEATDLITRDYVLYMTSNRVLIGAEIDKVISILLVTATLAVALVRARRTLIRSVADALAAKELSRFVAPEIASRIRSADDAIQAGDGWTTEATILFTDIEGFSGIAERLSPDTLMHTLNDYFTAAEGVVRAFGGVITQFQGDALLVTYNVVDPDPDHAANALGSALALQRLTRERRFGDGVVMRTRCGVNTGTLIAGAVGTGDRLLFTVHGDEVNIAARLEQMNKQFGTYVLASGQTVAAAGPAFAYRALGEMPVRGRSAPVAMFEVTGETEERMVAAATATPVTP